MSRGRSFDYAAIRATHASLTSGSMSARIARTAALSKCSEPTVIRALKMADARSSATTTHGPGAIGGARVARTLPVDHPATLEKRTLFPTMVFDVGDEWVLKEGKHSAKIGNVVAKGKLAGFHVYTLTLEERATCPTSCRHWGSCYGNNTPFAKRWRPGPALEWRLEREVAALELRHPNGFLIRLHSLGDFYSEDYVDFWTVLLLRHPALHVFGYTAHAGSAESGVAHKLAMLVRDHWPRFAIRFSNAQLFKCATVSLESPVQKPRDAIICPAQWTPSGKKAESCSDCALCWSTTRRIAFLQH